MAFIPATPGIVGFGGGSKPAVFQAVAPQYQLINQQTDDEGVDYRHCHDLLGDTLNVAISGVTICGGCYTIDAGGGPQDVEFSFTGVNGAFVATWNALTSRWEVVIGTATVHIFGSADGSCIGAPTDSTADVLLSLQCTGLNVFTALAQAAAAINIEIFNTLPTSLSVGTPNTFTLGQCGTGIAPAFVGSYGGTITITP